MKSTLPPNLLSSLLSALSEPVRLRLCRVLEREELTVGEAAQVVQLPQSTVSRHLKHLFEAGLIVKRSAGTSTLYRLLVDDMEQDAAAIWAVVRTQLGSDTECEEDARRLDLVLAQRRTDTMGFFGRIAGEWDALRADLFGTSFTARALLAMLSSDWVVADIGSGTGNAAEHLARFVKEVVCVDQSRPMLEAAEKRLSGYRNVRFVEASAEDLPLDDRSVDVATSFLLLHHIGEPERVLSEMARITRPGGVVLVVDMLEHGRDDYRRLMGHAHLGFSEDRVREMYTQAGLTTPSITSQPTEPDARGPSLFVATARKPT